ncbi:MAG: methyltransferase domain-containing protein [Anaeromyxobacter sp.]
MGRYAVTIVSPPGYVHASAFIEVAETLLHGLRALGHDAVLTDDPRPPGRRPIILGANLLARGNQKPARDAILYNLEQIDEGSSWLTPGFLALLGRHEVWDYSPRNAARYAALGLPPPRVVPIGYVPQLTRIPPAPAEDLDVLFYGSTNPRRQQILDALRARGLRVEAVFGVYGEARDQLIARAKVVLNVHYYEAKVFEIVRVSYLLANRRCVVSERGADPEEERALEQGVAFAPYEELVEACARLAADPAARARLAAAGHELMARRDAAGYLREVVGEAAPASPAPTPKTHAAPAAARSPSMIPLTPPLSLEDVLSMVAPAGKRILDVACGDGELGAHLLKNGAEQVVGLDPCARGLARARLTAVYGASPDGAPALPYPEGYFDVVLVEDLSRLLVPAQSLQHLTRWLAGSGRVVVVAPNVGHEAALTALLQQGRLPAEAGARPLTVGAALDLLAQAGLEVEEEAVVQRTEPGEAAPELGRVAALLGGDPAQLADSLTLVRAVLAARPRQPQGGRAGTLADPWAGSRSVKVLVAPQTGRADWEGVVAELARSLAGNPDVTLGVAVPAALLDPPPAGLQAATEGLSLDLLLTEAPQDAAGWQRLLGGASTYLALEPQPLLEAFAALAGVPVQRQG